LVNLVGASFNNRDIASTLKVRRFVAPWGCGKAGGETPNVGPADNDAADDDAPVEAAIAALFGADAGSEAAAAVRTAAHGALTIVTGGPGTGRTYSVTRTLALLRGLGGPSLRIALAAPTGKVAVRMQEAIDCCTIRITKRVIELILSARTKQPLHARPRGNEP